MNNGRDYSWEKIKEICESIKEKDVVSILPKEALDSLKTKNKGRFGQVVETILFNIETNQESEPDFVKAGIELKVTPLNPRKKSRNTNNYGEELLFSPKERVKLCTINYEKIVNDRDFDTSHLIQKCNKILFIFYLYDQDPKKMKIINYYLYEMKKDVNYLQIKRDYQTIVDKIVNGYAHQLSGADTCLLEACTSSSDSSIEVSQPNSKEKAKPRAFAFKQRQIRNILASINNEGISNLISFLNKKLAPYQNKTIHELAKEFNLKNVTNDKSTKNILLCKMLGISSYRDFFKTYSINKVMFKNIELTKNGTIKEEIGLIDVKFTQEFNDNKVQDFYDSELYDFIFNLNIVCFVWQQKENDIYFKSITLYKFTDEDVNDAKYVWEHTRDLWLTSRCIKSFNGKSYQYNFIKKSDDKTLHIRPHDAKRLKRYQMPNGEWITKFQYWLNNNKVKI